MQTLKTFWEYILKIKFAMLFYLMGAASISTPSNESNRELEPQEEPVRVIRGYELGECKEKCTSNLLLTDSYRKKDFFSKLY